MFFSPLRRLSVVDVRVMLVLIGAAAVLTFGSLLAQSLHGMAPIEAAADHVARTDVLVHEVMNARLNIAVFLASGDAVAYETGEQALLDLLSHIEREQSAEYFTLRELEQHAIDTLNAYRSLAGLIRADAPAEARHIVRRQVDEAASALERQAHDAFNSSVMAISDTSRLASTSLLSLGAKLMLALGLAVAVSWLVTSAIAAQSKRTLLQISAAVQKIAAGQYETRMELTGATNRDLVALSVAINAMAEALQNARQSEASATKQNNQQLLKLARQERLTAILEERQRLARELHDSVKQQLFSITLSAGAASNLIERAPALVKTHLEAIKDAGQYAQAEMTALLQELAPVPLHDKRLEDALLGFLAPLCETHGLKLLWRVAGTNTLTIAQEHALFRAVQEAASNSIRHGSASLLRVSLNFGLLTHVIVEDNGRGFLQETVPPASAGLSMMRGRLKRAGGRCEVQSTPGIGTRLTILLDLRQVKGAL